MQLPAALCLLRVGAAFYAVEDSSVDGNPIVQALGAAMKTPVLAFVDRSSCSFLPQGNRETDNGHLIQPRALFKLAQ